MPGLSEATPATVPRPSPDKASAAPAVGGLWLGTTPVLADGDGKLSFWGRADGAWAPTKTVAVHRGAVLAIAPHPDGSSVVTGGDDGRLVRTGVDGRSQELADLGRLWVHDVVASPVTGVIAAAIGHEVLILRNGGVGPTNRFRVPSTVGGLALDAKGRRLAIAHYGGVTLHWALLPASEGQHLAWRGSHLAVTWSPDGRYVVSTMQEQALHGWRLADGADMAMSGYTTKPRSLAWTPKGRWLLTSGAEAVVAWPFVGKTGAMDKSAEELGPAGVLVTRVAAHPIQEVHAAGYADGAVRLIRLADGAAIDIVAPGSGAVTTLAWSGKGQALLWGTSEGAAGVFTPERSG